MKNRDFNTIIYLIVVVLFANYLSVGLQNVASLSLIKSAASSSTLIVLLLFTLSSLFVYINRKYIKSKDGKFLRHLFIYVYVISVFFSIINPFGSKITYLLIILPYILFLFMYVSCYSVNDKISKILFLFILVFLTYRYAQEYTKVLAFSFKDYTTTNASYFVLYLFPLVLCVDNKWIKALSFIATLIIVVSSSKRGGTIAVVLAGFIYFITEYFLIKKKKINIGIILFCIVIAVVLVYGNKYIQDLAVFGRIQDLADDEGSGRVEIYRHTFSMISNSNIVQLFFGHGWDRVVSDSSLHFSAHNDFLEVIYDFGLLGFFLYLSLCYSLIKKSVFLIKIKSQYAPALFVSITLFILGSFVSHIVIYPSFMCMFTSCWGYIWGMERKKLILN